MTRLNRKICFILLLSLIISGNKVLNASDKLNEIRNAIIQKKANWIAAKNPLSELPDEARESLYGLKMENPRIDEVGVRRHSWKKKLPAKLDWRDNNGNWVTPVKDQTIPLGCGSCWAFSTIAQVESWWKIYTKDVNVNPDLSEQFLLSKKGDCDGGRMTIGLETIKIFGVPFEDCYAYQAEPDPEFTDICNDWMDYKVKIPGWFYATGVNPTVEEIKNAVIHHPVSAGMDVYSDFETYSEGVYQPVTQKIVGKHAVLIVGWDDEQECWICKNSWGTSWGEQGYFRIKYNTCDFGKLIPFIWDHENMEPIASVTSPEIRHEILHGDSISQNINIANRMALKMKYNILNLEDDPCFHITDHLSYSGKSWWSGDRFLKEDNNKSMQFLETPVLNFEQYKNIRLTFQAQWFFNSDSGKDGCSVWISQDGGKSFSHLFPDFPSYNCIHVSGFWFKNLGCAYTGWSGRSNGWKQAQFDLSCFRSDSIIIRFAMVSDSKIFTWDKYNHYGFFIDNIRITADEYILFENYGESVGDLVTRGYRISDYDWFNLSETRGSIEPFEDTDIEFCLNSCDMDTGTYNSTLGIILTDMVFPFYIIPCSTQLESPVSDLTEENARFDVNNFVLHQNYPNPFNSSTVISWQVGATGMSPLHVEVSIYNILGQKIKTLLNKHMSAGFHEVEFNASNLATGVYLYRIEVTDPERRTAAWQDMKKMFYIR